LKAQTLNIKYPKSTGNTFQNISILFKSIGFEASIWISSLLYLAFINNPAEAHFSICSLHFLGFGFCPGCGLGNSISYIFHGDILESFSAHPLGLFALIVLITRIVHLIKINRSIYGKHITTNALS